MKDLEKIYKEYNEKGFEVLGFPCNQFAEQEPGNNTEVKNSVKLIMVYLFQCLKKWKSEEKIHIQCLNILPKKHLLKV